ncbi:hypothetical protein F5Y11DRAFT_352029 [Daldinia sp. FL1419]|nr:hypothetical protein F5Y11DRAFT_352029 [Daldinia sp. FL1419]
MKVLVEYTKENVDLSEEILCAAASNRNKGPMIFEYLFRALGDGVNITEAVLVSAAEGGWLLEDLINLLKHRPNLPISEAVISDVVSNEFQGDELVEALFNHNPKISLKKVQITPRVVAAAAANKALGNELIPLLLAEIPGIRVEEMGLETAAGNPELGEELIKVLLHHDGNAHIGDRIMEAMVKNMKRGVGIFALFLEHDPNIQISNSMLKAAITNGNSKLLKVLLDRVDVNSKIPEAVVKEAIRDFRRY